MFLLIRLGLSVIFSTLGNEMLIYLWITPRVLSAALGLLYAFLFVFSQMVYEPVALLPQDIIVCSSTTIYFVSTSCSGCV